MSAKLLLVDDELGLREAVQAYLEDAGFIVEVANNAIEGWEKVQQVVPNLVISDVMMPQVDGYQFLQQLREDERFKSLPVIFLTAKGMTSDRIQGYQAGCDAYLSKPFDPEELEVMIKNLLERRAAASSSTELDDIKQQLNQIQGMLQQGTTLSATKPSIQIDFTPREQSVLNLVTEGLMNKEIARRLETSVRNVEKYVSRLFVKTGTNSRTELVRFAIEHGLNQS